jgi:hypothetical protein
VTLLTFSGEPISPYKPVYHKPDGTMRCPKPHCFGERIHRFRKSQTQLPLRHMILSRDDAPADRFALYSRRNLSV